MIYHYTSLTMFLTLVIQLNRMVLVDIFSLQGLADTKFASWICGINISPFMKIMLRNMAPFYLIGVLLVAFLLYTILAFIMRRFGMCKGPTGPSMAEEIVVQPIRKGKPYFHHDRLILTLLTLLYFSLMPMMKYLIDLAQCEATPLGVVWLPSPIMDCTSSTFSKLGTISMIVFIPLVLFISLVSILFLFLKTFKSKWIEKSLYGSMWTWFRFLSYDRDSFGEKPFWNIVDLLARIVFPIVISFSLANINLLIVLAPLLLFIVGLCYSIWSPFRYNLLLYWLGGISLCTISIASALSSQIMGSKHGPYIVNIVSYVLVLVVGGVFIVVQAAENGDSDMFYLPTQVFNYNEPNTDSKTL